jgi:siroheme synthase (precorrin-2 oxidase/ferrochelatase)
MLARRIKAMVEENLPQHTGVMARMAGQFRHRLERIFWGISASFLGAVF